MTVALLALLIPVLLHKAVAIIIDSTISFKHFAAVMRTQQPQRCSAARSVAEDEWHTDAGKPETWGRVHNTPVLENLSKLL